jgi:uncharacterized protein YbjT (DUF2867 family)
MILITGGSGNVGTELVRILRARGIPFRAMVRSPDAVHKMAPRAGVEVIAGDFNDPATIERALTGINRAFLLTPSSEQAEAQQSTFVEAARRAGVQHIVKLSQLAAAEDSPVRFLRYHAAIERAIRASGLQYTFLRPNLFMQGFLGFRHSIIAEGKFFVAAGDAEISAIDVRDIAAVAAAALTGEGHVGRTYDLTGPEALTHREMAERLSAALGRRVEFVDVPPDVMRGALIGVGLPVWQAEGLVEDYAHYRRGEASAVTSGVRDGAGTAPRTFSDFARDHAPAFSA